MRAGVEIPHAASFQGHVRNFFPFKPLRQLRQLVLLIDTFRKKLGIPLLPFLRKFSRKLILPRPQRIKRQRTDAVLLRHRVNCRPGD